MDFSSSLAISVFSCCFKASSKAPNGTVTEGGSLILLGSFPLRPVQYAAGLEHAPQALCLASSDRLESELAEISS